MNDLNKETITPIPNTPGEYVNLYKSKKKSIYMKIFIYMCFKFLFLLIIHLFVACWQDDSEGRPDIQYVEKTLMGMISGSNTIDSSNQENENSNSFGFSNTIDLIQARFDNMVRQHT